MTTYAITLATGQLGHAAALAGAERLLFVSGKDLGDRERQHGALVAAADEAGVRRVVYTSFIGAQTQPENPLTPEHGTTEDQLEASDIPEVVVLRNGYDQENLLGGLDGMLESGVMVGASGEGRIGAAARDDLAEAAVVALTDDAIAPGAYELTGPDLTTAELAAQVAEGAGRPVRYQEVSLEDFRAGMVAAGLPEPVADMFTAVERSAATGSMAGGGSEDLARLLGRAPTTVAETVRGVLAAR